ncbi:MAG: sister chromatid cohesion protein 1 [Bathelium mastoideum]|nr:MAG: sister chromatid cohesion protein 1 [Bathelium mastoideum]
MFYSETLLSKTGPLARVWLAANIERKLSKNNVLQQDIGSSVNAIVDQGQAPLALRLSGQLLLGVVRIYHRKTRYLLDDCHEALVKIKLAFKPGNVNLPTNQSHTVNPASLVLPDALTELDLFAPLPDPSLLLTQLPELDENQHDPTLLEPDSSQMLMGSIESGRNNQDEGQLLDDIDLGLDIGPDSHTSIDMSIEQGRQAPTPRAARDDLIDDNMNLYEDDLGLDIGGDEPAGRPSTSTLPNLGDRTTTQPAEEDVPMAGMDDDLGLDLGLTDEPAPTAAPVSRHRDSLSPLSSIRASEERELEASYQAAVHDTSIAPSDRDISMMQAPQRAKKRQRTLQADTEIEVRLKEIKEQQSNHERILKQPSFLPRDPLLLSLMTMQQSGGFVSNILGDGRSQGWAPELRGIFSIELVRKSGELKRKRDSGVADLDEGATAPAAAADSSLPGLDIPLDEDSGLGALSDGGAVQPPPPSSTRKSARFADVDEGVSLRPEDEEEEEEDDDAAARRLRSSEEERDPTLPPQAPDDFDETTMPILHPADAGPISAGTQHAVHLYRAQFTSQDPSAETSPSARRGASILFQELLPESRTSRTEATKMFFETLVLATKDAVKVEQSSARLGGDIRVRAKRGLWGAWAEEKAGGEIAEGEEEGGDGAEDSGGGGGGVPVGA